MECSMTRRIVSCCGGLLLLFMIDYMLHMWKLTVNWVVLRGIRMKRSKMFFAGLGEAINWIMAAVLIGSVMACGSSSQEPISSVEGVNNTGRKETSTPKNIPRIGLVMKTLTNPFFIEMERGARRAERVLGVELIVRTASQETSIEQQIQIVEDMIRLGVDGIVIAPGDSVRLVPILKKAVTDGIKVINIDNRLDPKMIFEADMPPIPFVSVDNEAAAYLAAQTLVAASEGRAKAAIIEGIRSADNARQRMEGAKRAFASHPEVELVASESANWKIDEAREVARRIFAEHPDIQIVFAANDMMGLGVLQYLRESNRSEVKVGGFDALAEAIEEVRHGQMEVTVDQQAAEQGFKGVELALRQLNGEVVPDITLVESQLVTAMTLR